MAEKKDEMEEILQIASQYGREWGMKFSARKCKVIQYNDERDNQWVLGNNVLEVVKKYTYLGMEVSNEGVGGERQRKINEGKTRKAAGMILNGGSRVANKYEVCRSLWKGMAVPYCLYGSEMINYTEKDFHQLEKVQDMMGRWALGAPKCTGLEAIRGDMGWSSFRERIAKGKLIFIKRLEDLEEDRWAKKVIMEEKAGSTWRKEIKRWKRRENLEDDWNRIKVKDIKRRIETNGRDRWRAGLVRKSTLKWYSRKQQPERIDWHVGDWGSKLLFKARTGTLEVNGRNREEQQQECSVCVGVKETVEHMIAECDMYEEYREQLIQKVTQVIGEEEWFRRINEEDGGITTVLGLYGDKEEAKKIVEIMKVYLVQSWKKRSEWTTTRH